MPPYTSSHPGCSQPRPKPTSHSDHQNRHTWRDHECDGHTSDLLHRDGLALRSAWWPDDDSQSQQNRLTSSLTATDVQSLGPVRARNDASLRALRFRASTAPDACRLAGSMHKSTD